MFAAPTELGNNEVVKLLATDRHGFGRVGRERVARELLEHGPLTAAALSLRLGITPTAVRRHLDAMVDEGVATSAPAPTRGKRGRGRPARIYRLSDEGHRGFGDAYDELAADALRFLEEQLGEEAVAEFAARRVSGMERRYLPLVTDVQAPQRAEVLAAALSGDGYAATISSVPSGTQVCQHHCPVQAVATQFPQLCEAETAAFGRLLGTHVQRLATIAHGDGICTTHVPAPVRRRRTTKTRKAAATRA